MIKTAFFLAAALMLMTPNLICAKEARMNNELLGATSAPFNLDKEITHINLPMHAPKGKASVEVYLLFENFTSLVRAPAFDVYVNLPPKDSPEKHPELQIGVLSMYGLPESSRTPEAHGLSFTEDVTVLWDRLAASSGWDPNNLRITFVPGPWDGDIKIRVGRVRLVAQPK